MAIFNTVYGGEWKWKPNDNTIAYYPLTSDTTVNDMKGIGTAYNLTNTNVTFWTNQWVSCANFNSNSRLENTSAPVWTNRTLCAWVYALSNSNNKWVICTWNNSNTNILWCSVWSTWVANMSDWQNYNIKWTTTITWWWHLITVTLSNWWASILYVDWVQENSYTFNIGSGNYICVWAKSIQHSEKYYWYISAVIVESVAWSANEVAKYYNSTKANYS